MFTFLEQRKQAKVQWLQDPNHSSVDNLNNVRHDASRHCRNKKKEYLKAKIDEFETNSKIKNIRDLSQTPTVFWLGGETIFRSFLNVRGVIDVRQTEIHTAESLVPEPSAFEVELAIEKLKRHKSPGIDQIPAEMIKAVDRTIHSEIYKLTNFIWNKQEFPEVWKELIIVPFYKKKGNKKQIVVIIEAYRFCQLHTTFYPAPFGN